MEPLGTALLIGTIGGLLIVSAVTSPISQRLGVPVLVVFLGLGMLAGSEGVIGIEFDDYSLAFRLGVVALVLILFDGGLNTRADTFRRAVLPASLLATVAVVITAVIIAAVGRLVGLSWPIALLVGGVVSSTDAAAVFSVLRGSRVRLRQTTSSLLEVESGLNDPMAVLLTVITTEVLVGARALDWSAASFLGSQMLIGACGGVILGALGWALLRWIQLPAGGLYPVLTVGLAFVAFGAPTLMNGSGFLTVYLAAILIGATPLPYRPGVLRVHDALAWLAQILMFLMLGLLVFPSRLWPLLPQGFVLALVLAFVARPLAVLMTLWPFRFSRSEKAFVAWVGLRGAVPIILATYPALRGVPNGDQIFHLVFFVVVVNSFIPGSGVAWLARRFGLARHSPRPAPASVELISLREYPGQFLWYLVRPVSAVSNAMVRDLPLPEGCVLTMILRGDDILAPRGPTVLQPGDHVCLFVTHGNRQLLDLLFGPPDDEDPI